ncbi:methyltransferase [Pedobacter psychrophilus]|uniref:Methyltransferase n=1 Tax=Pedobacter psychrophilus TaxID=1826909 RepID=A0A179DAY6_9SPHI|nr:O-methyltransferase [Pedobacter psychrophilus]OAQ37942.1 methyltransferase [Pedobacter psychrophilus]
MQIISEELNHYLSTTCENENELLTKIDRETQLEVLMPRMISGHYQGRVLCMLSKMLNPKRILEVGTFTGYATICLAEGLANDGKIITIDINEELEDKVRGYFLESGLAHKIDYLIGNAVELIHDINEEFDLVFIDADKKNNGVYYDLVFDKLKSGGIILVDNVLWSGKVLTNINDTDTSNISTFNQKVTNDTRVEKLILPIRDGIFVIRKK